MTLRLPIVNLAGSYGELPAGDELAGTILASLTQLLGFTPANILEVEANSRAARVTYRPQAEAGEREMAYNISHHSLGFIFSHTATTQSWTNAEVMTVGNPGMPTIGFLRRLTVAAATSALSGARAGQARMMMSQFVPMIGMGAGSRWVLPPVNAAYTANPGPDYKSLRTGQLSPQLIIQGALNEAPIATDASGVQFTSKTLGEAQGGAPSSVGTNIPPTTIFDYNIDGSYIIAPFGGFGLTSSFPAAATSQSVSYSVCMQWSEWQARAPI